MSTVELDAEYMYKAAFNESADVDNPQEAYIREETVQIVSQAVNALPEKYRIILLMYYSVDMTTEKIAEELGLSKGTVTSRLKRARDKVRKNLEDNGYER